MTRRILTALAFTFAIGLIVNTQEYYRGASGGAGVFSSITATGNFTTTAGSFFMPDAGFISTATRGDFSFPANGVVQLRNGAGTSFTRLILGSNDATTNGVSLKLSGGNLLIRKGDDSSDSPFNAATITASGNISLVGGASKINTYNGIATAGFGVPAIYGALNITAQTSNATIASYANGAADGDFEVSGQMNVTASTTLATTITCTYTDVTSSARTMVLPVTAENGTMVAAGAISGAGATRWSTTVQHIRAKASTTISIITSAGTFTGVTYSASGAIRQIS